LFYRTVRTDAFTGMDVNSAGYLGHVLTRLYATFRSNLWKKV
jgi:hypothetical protein